jgi:MoaA/NifB/PqqE/SkfB family radical SAM enzyme
MPRHVSTHRIVCIRLTRRCNRSCEFCLSLSGPEHAHPVRDVRHTLARLRDLGTEKISYSGGEPLLVEGFDDLIALGHQLGLAQIVTTNGDVLLRKIPSWIAEIESIKLSFYGLHDVHDRLMGAGNYHDLMGLAQRMSHDLGASVGANYMLTPASLLQLGAFLDDCLVARISRVLILTYIRNAAPEINAKYTLEDTAASIEEARQQAIRFAGRFPGGVKVHDYSQKDFFIVLDDRDRLTLPTSDGTPDFILGHVDAETLSLPTGERLPSCEALEEVWNVRLNTSAIVSIDEP